MDHCKLWVLAHAFKCELILYLLNLKFICIFSQFIMRSWLDISVKPREFIWGNAVFPEGISIFHQSQPEYSTYGKTRYLVCKICEKKHLWKSDFLRKDKSHDRSWTALSMLLSTEIINIGW